MAAVRTRSSGADGGAAPGLFLRRPHRDAHLHHLSGQHVRPGEECVGHVCFSRSGELLSREGRGRLSAAHVAGACARIPVAAEGRAQPVSAQPAVDHLGRASRQDQPRQHARGSVPRLLLGQGADECPALILGAATHGQLIFRPLRLPPVCPPLACPAAQVQFPSSSNIIVDLSNLPPPAAVADRIPCTGSTMQCNGISTYLQSGACASVRQQWLQWALAEAQTVSAPWCGGQGPASRRWRWAEGAWRDMCPSVGPHCLLNAALWH